MTSYVYRIQKEVLNGGDTRYYPQYKEMSNYVLVQLLLDFAYCWQDIGFRYIDGANSACHDAQKSIDYHKRRQIKNEANKVVKIEYIDSCKNE